MDDRRQTLGVHGINFALRSSKAFYCLVERTSLGAGSERANPDTETAGTIITLWLGRSNAERLG